MPKIKCSIQEVIPIKKSKQNPLIAHFQNGQPGNDAVRSVDVCLATDRLNQNSEKVLLAATNDHIYEGYIGRDFPANLKRTVIAIRKKDSNEVKIVEVSEANLMSYHYNLTTQNAEKPIESTKTMSTEGARRILLKDFGGKKAMRVLDRKEKMKINVDVVKDALDKTLMEFTQSLEKEDEFDKEKIEQDRIMEEMMPQMNKEAVKLNEVYKIADIIEPKILDSLNDDAVKLLKMSADEMPIKVKYLKSVIESVQRSKIPDDPNSLLKVKACIFTDALITYFRQVNQVRQNQRVQLRNLTGATMKLDSYIKKKFGQPNSSQTTKTNYVVHKATCFIIVLSLLISDRFELDIQNIVEEMGIAKTNILKMINNIAVRPKSKTNMLTIRLPAQLKFFSTSFRKRRTL